MDEFDLFAVKSEKANKTNSSIRFLGEFMARQSTFQIDWPLANVLLSNINSVLHSKNHA